MKERRDKYLMIRVNDGEKEETITKSIARGFESISSYIRSLVKKDRVK